MLKSITKNMFDVVAGITIIAVVFTCGDNLHSAPAGKRVEASRYSFIRHYGHSDRWRYVVG